MRILALLFLFVSFLVDAQNLILNPGAEIEPLTANGWTQTCSGACIWIGIPAEKGSTHSGSGHFYAGDNSGTNVELYQDVDVSSYASSIDGGSASFTFSAWTSSYNISGGTCQNDPGQIIVEFRNAANVFISNMVSSGWRFHLTWASYAPAAVIAPANTRYIRVRLISRKDCGTAADGYFDDLSLTTTAPLPVSLINFTGTEKQNSILLSWSTSSETNNQYFKIEKSIDGKAWFEIGKVTGVGNSSSLQNYQYEDQNPRSGVQYYRLKQTDLDGQEANYNAITVNYRSEIELLLFPNPSNGIVTLQTSEELPDGKIRVVNLAGKVVFELNAHGNVNELDLNHLPMGLYIVELSNAGSVSRTPLAKE